MEEVIEYYVVPKCNDAEWAGNDIVTKCIIPPEEFDELPVSVNTNESYIMDDWAPRHLLGPDVRKIRLSVGVRGSKEHVPTQPASASGATEALPHSQAVEGTINDMEHEPHSSTDSVQQKRKETAEDMQWAAKARKLLRQRSDTVKVLQGAMEDIANEIAKQFDAHNYVQGDKMARSVESWTRKI